MVELAIPRDDGKVERLIWAGDGQPPTVQEYESDEALLMERVREQHNDLWERVKCPIRFVSDRLLGGE